MAKIKLFKKQFVNIDIFFSIRFSWKMENW